MEAAANRSSPMRSQPLPKPKRSFWRIRLSLKAFVTLEELPEDVFVAIAVVGVRVPLPIHVLVSTFTLRTTHSRSSTYIPLQNLPKACESRQGPLIRFREQKRRRRFGLQEIRQRSTLTWDSRSLSTMVLSACRNTFGGYRTSCILRLRRCSDISRSNAVLLGFLLRRAHLSMPSPPASPSTRYV
jgi:hypothetical protein